MSKFIICKFGGTSVASLARWENVALIAKKHLAKNQKPIIVCSAPKGVSNLLIEAIHQALSSTAMPTYEAIETIYVSLATELQVDIELIQGTLNELKQLLQGVALVGEISARLHAKILSFGELMLTRLGSAYLNQIGLKTTYLDARDYLESESFLHQTPEQIYLNASCAFTPNIEKQQQLNQIETELFITQGFIAHNKQNETVLLGRGGSDTSAAYFSATLEAQACEIWTDVPGIYSANPRWIPEARRLSHLNYKEAQEIASMGAKVIHPNCIAPVRNANIPLYIKDTTNPNHPGTIVSIDSDQSPQIKSIQIQQGIYLVSLESISMWQQVGFLADVFETFKRQGFSVDLVSTSQASVTVSLDAIHNHFQPERLNALITALSQLGNAKLIGPCAAISLVGHQIRTILAELSNAFRVFEAHHIYLVSQASNDLNFTFVVDEDQAVKLAQKLHHLLIEQNQKYFGQSKTWLEEFGEKQPASEKNWWEHKREELLKIAKKNTPHYIYDLETVRAQGEKLLGCNNISRFFYAIKANSHPAILETLYQLGFQFECVSLQEAEMLQTLLPNLKPEKILFTPNFAPRAEYVAALQKGVLLTIDSLHPLLHWGELLRGKQVMIRLDLGTGAGHHKYVCTGGNDSKFGIPLDHIDKLKTLLKTYDVSVLGLHAHSGSGILQTNHWHTQALQLIKQLEHFPDVRILNLGGGLGVPDYLNQRALDLTAFNAHLTPLKQAYPKLEFWLEPGRFLVAQAGVIISRVTQLKTKGQSHFVGLDTGMNSLIRPSLYGAYHEIVNLSRIGQPTTQLVHLVGPICESGDLLGLSRPFPETAEGDVILIANAGAYGFVMSSHYNMRDPAAEIPLD